MIINERFLSLGKKARRINLGLMMFVCAFIAFRNADII
jgi:hypothetical protein